VEQQLGYWLQVYHISGVTSLSYNLVQGGCPVGATCDHVIDADPQFMDADGPDDVIGTLDDDLRLQPGSPAINAGDNAALPADTYDLDKDGDTSEPIPVDLAGNERVYGGDQVDLGAYEVQGPGAAFTATPISGTVPLTVTFTDLSTGGPTSWAWHFGDGGTSTAQHPVYTYTLPGIYTVTLAVGNTTGSDILTRTNFITVTR